MCSCIIAAERKLWGSGQQEKSWIVLTDAPVLYSCILQYSFLIKAIAGASDELVGARWIPVAQYGYKHTQRDLKQSHRYVCVVNVLSVLNDEV